MISGGCNLVLSDLDRPTFWFHIRTYERLFQFNGFDLMHAAKFS